MSGKNGHLLEMETFGNIWKHLETQYIYPCELFWWISILINMVTKKPLKPLKIIKNN
jgi:hypothetical protein